MREIPCLEEAGGATPEIFPKRRSVMLNAFGVPESAQVITYLLLSFSFYCGILLLVSKEAFEMFDKSLQREYGVKRTILPFLEKTRIDIVDPLLLKYRLAAGLLISVTSFVLLLIYKF